jgi:N-acetylneuraminic acid mutarotase
MYEPASGLIYVFGGMWYQTTTTGPISRTDLAPTDEAWAFDPQTGQWWQLADLPGPVAGHAAAPTSDGRIVLFAQGSTLFYDPATDRWQDVTPPDAFGD